MSVIFWSLDMTQVSLKLKSLTPSRSNNNGGLNYLDIQRNLLYEQLLITNGLLFKIIFHVLLGGNNSIDGCTGSDLVGWTAKAAALVG